MYALILKFQIRLVQRMQPDVGHELSYDTFASSQFPRTTFL